MGNCLGVKEEIIKVTKMDGKVLEYRAPIQVHEVVSGYMGHGISTKFPVSQYLEPNTELTSGNTYHLVPLPNRLPKASKKVRFSMPDSETESPKNTGLSIKLVISKQELKEMIENGALSVDRIASQLQKEDDDGDKFDDDSVRSKSWKPELNSIPEIY